MAALRVLSLDRPCPLSRAEDRDFFCPTCRQRVYALSRRTEPEALALLGREDAPPCVSFRTDARGRMRFAGRSVVPMLGLVLATGCATARPESSRISEPVPVDASAGLSLGGLSQFTHRYEVEGVKANSPSFGALTITIIIDGRRRSFGVGG